MTKIKPKENTTYKKIYNTVRSLLSTLLSDKDLNYLLTKFSTNPIFLESICLTATWFKTSLDNGLPNLESQLSELGVANLEACFAYTMYDYVRDGKIESSYVSSAISVANILIQKSLTTFMHLSPTKALCIEILKMCRTIDCFYLKDIEPSTNRTQTVRDFINYSDTIFEKSIGMAITPLIVLGLHGYSPNTTQYKHTYNFFKHYLTARQLSDDSDDFHQDLVRGLLTPATLLLKMDRYSPKQIKTIIRTRINKHFKKALNELGMIRNFNKSAFTEKYVVPC